MGTEFNPGNRERSAGVQLNHETRSQRSNGSGRYRRHNNHRTQVPTPRRIEIFFHQFDGQYYLTGRPGRRRDWEANIAATPEFTLHLKRGVVEAISVAGELEPDPDERARILLRALVESWDSDPEKASVAVHRWVEESPFIRFKPI